MKKTLPLIIILTIIAFLPGVIGALVHTGTGIMPLDLIIFTLLPFIVIFFLMILLFKYPTEVAAPVSVGKPSRAPSMESLQAEEAVGDVASVEPAVEAETEVAEEPAAVAAEPSVTCPECGGAVTMNDPKCPHCGVKFEDEKGGVVAEQPIAEQPAAEPEYFPEETELTEPKPAEEKAPADFGLKCPTCGGSVGLDEKFCPHCGADFEEKGDKDIEAGKSEEELDAMFGIAPEEKVEAKKEEPKPEPPKSDEITLSYEEPAEDIPAPKNKKGKKKR